MAELVKLQNRLPTVKLSVGFESSAGLGRPVPVVWIEIQRGSSMIARIRASREELGVPADFEPATYRYSEPLFAFSQDLGDQIGAATSTAMGEEAVLWLQLADPVGFLSVLPLERMLRPFVGDRPIMRIPNFALSPAMPADSIDIAVCLSEPTASISFDGLAFLRGFIPALLDAYPARIHIFTDTYTYQEMTIDPSLGRFTGAAARLVLHDPAGAPPAARTATESMSDSGTAVTNPWLLWMLQELAGITVDVVHFVTHGYTRSGQSALTLAESPMTNEDRMWSRFGPNQAAAWLVQLGAWAVGFTSPVQNYSSMGLREFFDDLARLRAGPILLHDAGLDPLSTEAARAYADLFSGQQPELLPATSLYVHPLVFSENRYPGETGVDSFADVVVSSSLGAEPPTTPAPAWVTSTRRYLEQSVATMFPEPEEPTSTAQVAAGEGAERALRFVNEVLGRLGNSS